eukprot:c22171_g1_i2 orf=2-211(-)
MEVKDGTCPENADAELLNIYMQAQLSSHINEIGGCREMQPFQETLMAVNKRSCIMYRRGKKQLTQIFLRE